MLAFEKAAIIAIIAMGLVVIAAVAMGQEASQECQRIAGAIAIYGDCR